MALACGLLLGSYYCYDNPGVIEKQLEAQFHIDSTTWSLLYSVYSYPNMVLPLFGGIFLDMIGIRVGIILFCILLTCGQFVCVVGGYTEKFWVLILGRTIFGLGGESFNVA